jgi:hypothetical protein
MRPGSDLDRAAGHRDSTAPDGPPVAGPEIPISAAVVVNKISVNRSRSVVATGDRGGKAIGAIGIDPHGEGEAVRIDC